MDSSVTRKFVSFFILAGASYAWGADPLVMGCGDLLKSQFRSGHLIPGRPPNS
jgi:hypothetical protein